MTPYTWRNFCCLYLNYRVLLYSCYVSLAIENVLPVCTTSQNKTKMPNNEHPLKLNAENLYATVWLASERSCASKFLYCSTTSSGGISTRNTWCITSHLCNIVHKKNREGWYQRASTWYKKNGSLISPEKVEGVKRQSEPSVWSVSNAASKEVSEQAHKLAFVLGTWNAVSIHSFPILGVYVAPMNADMVLPELFFDTSNYFWANCPHWYVLRGYADVGSGPQQVFFSLVRKQN